MKTLAAAALAVCIPFAALAQSAPPPPPPVAPAAPAAPTVTAEEAPEGALDLSLYPEARRDEVWARYAPKSQLSMNVLYPLGGAPLSGMGVLGIPFEYERSLSRNWSLLGVVQPTWRVGALGQTEFTWALGAGTRYYVSGNAPQGLWLGMLVDHALGGRTVTVRQELGYTAVLDNGLSLSTGAGLGVTFARGVYLPFSDFEWPFFPAAGLRFSVGYAL